MRRNPKTAVFEITPESTAETSGDDSRYASGSHPWNGKSGAFTANAAAKPRKIQPDELVGESTRSNVPCERPSTMTETSISSEPAIVKATNLNVAPSRPAPPQTPTST